VPPQQESHETTQPAQVTAGYDGQSAAGAKAKKAQPSAGVKKGEPEKERGLNASYTV